MAVVSTEIGLDVKKDKEKQTALFKHWVLKEGNLEKLIADKNSDEYVIFEKVDSFLPDSIKKGKGVKDSKQDSERQQLKALKVILCRIPQMKLDTSHPHEPPVPTGKKLFTVFILFGNGERVTHPQENPTWELFPSDLGKFDNLTRALFFGYLHYSFPDVGFSPDGWEKSHRIKASLKQSDSFDTHVFLGFRTEEMRIESVDSLFDKLHEIEVIDTYDCQFLKKVSQCRELAIEETAFFAQIEKALKEKDYKTAVEIAKQAHEFSRKQAIARGTIKCKSSGDKNIYLYIEDSNIAFQLGEALEIVSPLEAIAAFEILASYLDEEAVDFIYESPYTEKAIEKISDIRISLIDSPTTVDEVEKRKLRGQALQACWLHVAVETDDILRKKTLRQFLNLLEEQSGFASMSMDPRQKLFFDKDLPDNPVDESDFQANLFFMMADKIYQQEKQFEKKIRVEEDIKVQKERILGESSSEATELVSLSKRVELDVLEGEKEKMITSSKSWILTYGNREKLISDENSTEFVIYEKRVNSVISSSSTKDIDVKQGTEALQTQALKIVLCRTAEADPQAQQVTIGKKVFTVVILFGNGKKIEKDQDSFYLEWGSFPYAPGELDKFTNVVFENYACFSFLDYRDEQHAAKSKLLRKPGSFNTELFLAFTTGEMSRVVTNNLFEKLHKLGWIDSEDCQFLKTISYHRMPAAEETRLSRLLNSALSKKDYKAAVEFAGQIHDLSRKQALVGPPKRFFIEGCDVAFQLGEILERISPVEAIAAFELLTIYESSEGVFGKTYLSPYTEKAQDRIQSILARLMDSSRSEGEARKYREKAIRACLARRELEDPKIRKQWFLKLLNLLEVQCGCKPKDPSQKLFKFIEAFSGDGIPETFLLMSNVFLTMADKIYQQRKDFGMEPLACSSSASSSSSSAWSGSSIQIAPKKVSSLLERSLSILPITALDEGDDGQDTLSVGSLHPKGLSSTLEEESPSEKDLKKASEMKQKAEGRDSEQAQAIRPFLARCKLKSDGDKLPEPGLAFRRAAAAGLEEVISALAQNARILSLDINESGPGLGKTALHFAVIRKREKVVSQLIQMRAKLDIRDAQSKTAVDYASESDNENIKKLLKQS